MFRLTYTKKQRVAWKFTVRLMWKSDHLMERQNVTKKKIATSNSIFLHRKWWDILLPLNNRVRKMTNKNNELCF